jgi:hypothetical protein
MAADQRRLTRIEKKTLIGVHPRSSAAILKKDLEVKQTVWQLE